MSNGSIRLKTTIRPEKSWTKSWAIGSFFLNRKPNCTVQTSSVRLEVQLIFLLTPNEINFGFYSSISSFINSRTTLHSLYIFLLSLPLTIVQLYLGINRDEAPDIVACKKLVILCLLRSRRRYMFFIHYIIY